MRKISKPLDLSKLNTAPLKKAEASVAPRPKLINMVASKKR